VWGVSRHGCAIHPLAIRSSTYDCPTISPVHIQSASSGGGDVLHNRRKEHLSEKISPCYQSCRKIHFKSTCDALPRLSQSGIRLLHSARNDSFPKKFLETAPGQLDRKFDSPTPLMADRRLPSSAPMP